MPRRMEIGREVIRPYDDPLMACCRLSGDVGGNLFDSAPS